MRPRVLFTVEAVLAKKDKIGERNYMPKTLTGLVNPLDRSYAAAGERTRVYRFKNGLEVIVHDEL